MWLIKGGWSRHRAEGVVVVPATPRQQPPSTTLFTWLITGAGALHGFFGGVAGRTCRPRRRDPRGGDWRRRPGAPNALEPRRTRPRGTLAPGQPRRPGRALRPPRRHELLSLSHPPGGNPRTTGTSRPTSGEQVPTAEAREEVVRRGRSTTRPPVAPSPPRGAPGTPGPQVQLVRSCCSPGCSWCADNRRYVITRGKQGGKGPPKATCEASGGLPRGTSAPLDVLEARQRRCQLAAHRSTEGLHQGERSHLRLDGRFGVGVHR